MLAEEAAQRPAEETLSGSSSALENERHLGRSGGVLHRPGQPFENVIGRMLSLDAPLAVPS